MKICKICKNEYTEITNSHTMTHGITLSQYEEWFPNDTLDFYLLAQPQRWNYTAGQLIQGLQNIGTNLICLYDTNFAKVVPPTEVVIGLIPFARALILIDETGRDGEEYLPYSDPYKFKGIYIDAAPHTQLLMDSRTYPVYFKAENDKVHPEVHSLPYSIEKRYYSSAREKDVSASLLMKPDTGLRVEVYNHFREMSLPDTFIGELYDAVKTDWNKVTDGRSNSLYYQMLARSKISIAVLGKNQQNNARFFEILANGCLLFSRKWNVDMITPFTDGVNYIEYTNMVEMDEKVRYYLSHSDELAIVANNGYQFAQQYHTTEVRAQYVLDQIAAAGL